jgi:hypothetical protein
VQRCYTFRCNQASALTAFYANGYKSGRATFQNCVGVCVYGGSISVTTNTRITYTNNVQQNARGVLLYFCGVDGIYTNNYFWGNSVTGASGGSVSAYNAINATISGNHYDNNTCALSMGLTTVNCIDTDSVFGAEMANTADIFILAGANPDYTLKSPTGDLIIDETYLPDIVVGAALKIVDFNDISKNDKVYYAFGQTRRTNADLSDTTVHTAGGSALRFEPTYTEEVFTFSFDVPT